MTLIIIFLVVNFLIARLLIKLTFKLSALYIENSQILAPTLKKEQYDFYLKIYENPSCLDNIPFLHLPLYNLFACHVVYMGIINTKIKLNQ
jgi:hypothetical protein